MTKVASAKDIEESLACLTKPVSYWGQLIFGQQALSVTYLKLEGFVFSGFHPATCLLAPPVNG